MAIITSFFGILEPSTFSIATVLFIIGFIIYELPRSVKIMDGEYTAGFYPEEGRVIDIFVLFLGLLAIAFLYLFGGMEEVTDFMRYDPLMPVFLIILIAVPVFVTLGYLKRFLARLNKQESVTIFLVQSFLDLGHTIFLICFSLLFVPVILYLLFSWLRG